MGDRPGGAESRDRTKEPVGGLVAAANALTARWARTHVQGNVALSGAGCWVLLTALASGASGEARTELERAVGVAAAQGAEATVAMLDLLASIAPLRTALGVWSRVVLDPEWVGRLPPGVIGRLTDDVEADQDRIDRWVAAATGNRIATMPVTVSERTQLLLASALALEVDWRQPFTESGFCQHGAWGRAHVPRLVRSTRDLTELRVVETATGPLTLLRVSGDADVDVHLILAGGGAAAPGAVLASGMTAIGTAEGRTGDLLPEGEPGPGVRVERITSPDPGDWMRVITCPFEIDASHDLVASPHVFGLKRATDRTAGHFPGISAVPLAIDEARQDVTATFNRTGFRATAVTAISMGIGSARPAPSEEHQVRRVHVTFDRPFGFAAIHRPTGLVLVAGWVDDPGAQAEGRSRS